MIQSLVHHLHHLHSMKWCLHTNTHKIQCMKGFWVSIRHKICTMKRGKHGEHIGMVKSCTAHMCLGHVCPRHLTEINMQRYQLVDQHLHTSNMHHIQIFPLISLRKIKSGQIGSHITKPCLAPRIVNHPLNQSHGKDPQGMRNMGISLHVKKAQSALDTHVQGNLVKLAHWSSYLLCHHI